MTANHDYKYRNRMRAGAPAVGAPALVVPSPPRVFGQVARQARPILTARPVDWSACRRSR
ncbi:hypothetical protein [Haladaptatus litoreus]|uniref:hypothetical protein n=1 Tax=Haladaptatus litoreus TaxID=553468 RepID=UPI0011155A35|nr:hypothetical protein [Haladaptatus litoreus]